MSADTLGVHIYYMAIGWHTCSGGAYMLADMLGACIYYMAVIWHTCSANTHLEHAYIIWPSAGMLAVGVHIYQPTCLECKKYIWANMLYAAQRYISARIGWYTICTTLAHI